MFFDSYDTPVFRPPSEARSFILRVTRGCAHNKCTYCNMYRGVPFQVLTEEEVARQIEAAAVHGGPIILGNVFVDGEHGFCRFGAVDNGIIKHGRRNQVKFKL